jgi:hypothetical protein
MGGRKLWNCGIPQDFHSSLKQFKGRIYFKLFLKELVKRVFNKNNKLQKRCCNVPEKTKKTPAGINAPAGVQLKFYLI